MKSQDILETAIRIAEKSINYTALGTIFAQNELEDDLLETLISDESTTMITKELIFRYCDFSRGRMFNLLTNQSRRMLHSAANNKTANSRLARVFIEDNNRQALGRLLTTNNSVEGIVKLEIAVKLLREHENVERYIDSYISEAQTSVNQLRALRDAAEQMGSKYAGVVTNKIKMLELQEKLQHRSGKILHQDVKLTARESFEKLISSEHTSFLDVRTFLREAERGEVTGDMIERIFDTFLAGHSGPTAEMYKNRLAVYPAASREVRVKIADELPEYKAQVVKFLVCANDQNFKHVERMVEDHPELPVEAMMDFFNSI